MVGDKEITLSVVFQRLLIVAIGEVQPYNYPPKTDQFRGKPTGQAGQ